MKRFVLILIGIAMLVTGFFAHAGESNSSSQSTAPVMVSVNYCRTNAFFSAGYLYNTAFCDVGSKGLLCVRRPENGDFVRGPIRQGVAEGATLAVIGTLGMFGYDQNYSCAQISGVLINPPMTPEEYRKSQKYSLPKR